MSTRCQIRFFDKVGGQKHLGTKATLYHHTDGNPEFMVPFLLSYLERIAYHLEWSDNSDSWDAESVASLFVVFSMTNRNAPEFPNLRSITKDISLRKVTKNFRYRSNSQYPGLPEFMIAQCEHGDIEYLYNVTIKNNPAHGKQRFDYSIECFDVRNGFDFLDKTLEESMQKRNIKGIIKSWHESFDETKWRTK